MAKVGEFSVMLDHGVMTHASCFDWADQSLPNPFDGGFYDDLFIKGVLRRPKQGELRQKNLDAIYTVGRLIREGEISAFTYVELLAESMKDYLGGKPLYAFKGCEIQKAHSPIERSKFFNFGFDGFVRKGGKKDRKQKNLGGSQVEFLEWLCEFERTDIVSLVDTYGDDFLSNFEIESFRELDWFKQFSARLRSSENLPDAFHVWATKRNEISCFLTLDLKLINQVKQIKNEKSGFKIAPLVLSPVELLRELGVGKQDEIPYEYDRFYKMADIQDLI